MIFRASIARRQGLLAVFLGATVTGCFSDGARGRTLGDENRPPPPPSDSDVVPTFPVDGLTPGESLPDVAVDMSQPRVALRVAETIDLAPLFAPDAKLVGIAISPSGYPHDGSGARYVLEAHTGLYALTTTGSGTSAELVFDLRSATALRGADTIEAPVELTDVAFDPRSTDGAPLFVATAENDGFAFGLSNTLLHSYFCYFPDTSLPAQVEAEPSVSQTLRAQGIAIKERTEAVALNALTGQIFAQPRTFRLDNGEVAGSELFVFEQTGGQPVGTRRFEAIDFAAGGMAVVFQLQLAFGYRDDIFVTDGWGSAMQRLGALDGVQAIEGMAFDDDGGLFVLDGPGKRLLRIDTDTLNERFATLAGASAP